MPARTSLWRGSYCPRDLLAVGPAGLAIALMIAATAGAADDMASRRLQVSQMTAGEQQELLRKQEQFLALPPEEQNRLRALQAAIDSDTHAERLRQVLKHYHEWLKTLSPAERAELAELAPDDRVKRIKQIQQRQYAARVQAQQAEVLSIKDMQAILRWTEGILWQHREAVLKELPSNWRKKLENEDEPRQRRALLLAASFSSRRGGAHPLAMVENQDIETLSAKLSERAREELLKAPDLQDQLKLLRGWIGVSMHRLEPWQGRRKLPPPAEQELAQFFQNDLRPQQRDRLLKMPNEQMREELRRMYFEHERWNPNSPGRDAQSPEGRPFDHKGPRPKGTREPRGAGPPKERPGEKQQP